jgi:hypothetical protein
MCTRTAYLRMPLCHPYENEASNPQSQWSILHRTCYCRLAWHILSRDQRTYCWLPLGSICYQFVPTEWWLAHCLRSPQLGKYHISVPGPQQYFREVSLENIECSKRRLSLAVSWMLPTVLKKMFEVMRQEDMLLRCTSDPAEIVSIVQYSKHLLIVSHRVQHDAIRYSCRRLAVWVWSKHQGT